MLQKSLHTHLKRRTEYKFIGETFTTESCKQFRDKITEKLNEKPESFVLNGDYSAATDHLKIEVVHIIGRAIIDKLRATDDESCVVDMLCELVEIELLQPQFLIPSEVPKDVDPES